MTYFASDYTRTFGKLHHKLIESLVEIAKHGGKQAIAAPRGRGKTQIVKGVLAYLVFAGWVHFPVPIGPTTEHARELYEDFRRKVMFNDLLFEDFPEVCAPVRALEGAPQRAGKQHIDGVLTRIEWRAERLRLADVPAKYRGPIDYGGVRMEFRGLDASIRGINRDGDRPDFVPIDEPETRESAKSESQIKDRENAIDKDINGLAGEDRELAQVMITTVQNNYCISAIYTDPESKPSWMGQRFGWVEKWPKEWEDEEGKWHTYIAMRAEDQRNGDRYGRKATEYYLANRDSMDAGGELLADNYKAKKLDDGWLTVHSAWQVVFNQIADTSFEAFCTEYQNQPPEQETIQTLELTYGEVSSSRSGLERLQLPEWKSCITRGIDMGKVNCWFVDVAWSLDGTGSVIDYGKFTTFGLSKQSSHEAIESAMLTAVESFVAEREGYEVDLAFVDSGYKPDAVYEACRRIDGPYYPLKGPDSKFRIPNASDKIRPYFECYASQVFDAYQRPLWLFHPNTEYWKNWTQERWQIETWEAQGIRTAGSMALFEPPHGDIRYHTTFAKSMISERLTHIPLPGKGYKTVWDVVDRGNNHWLDCIGYAASAAAVLGVRLVDTKEYEPRPVKKIKPTQSPFIRDGRAYLATQR